MSEAPSEPRPYGRPLVQKLTIEGPAGPLEAIAETPGGFDGRRAAVVCHPHPLYGGTMDNKVVTMTARAMHEAGVATVRFNFRGVGASGGSFDDARGETEDALTVATWAESRWPGAQLLVAGFSFGAYVAYRVAGLRAVERVITIAPPVRRFDFDFEAHPRPKAPWFVIQGDHDELVDFHAVREWTARAVPPPALTVIEGAEHFFHGRLNDLRAAVSASLAG